ncbi:hypothetical protein DFH09DRAFT_1326843 [Mycena vulgaris]|nr:hypothetical protein DFH09DRAFT_1326843 [Mycena vulgaris]
MENTTTRRGRGVRGLIRTQRCLAQGLWTSTAARTRALNTRYAQAHCVGVHPPTSHPTPLDTPQRRPLNFPASHVDSAAARTVEACMDFRGTPAKHPRCASRRWNPCTGGALETSTARSVRTHTHPRRLHPRVFRNVGHLRAGASRPPPFLLLALTYRRRARFPRPAAPHPTLQLRASLRTTKSVTTVTDEDNGDAAASVESDCGYTLNEGGDAGGGGADIRWGCACGTECTVYLTLVYVAGAWVEGAAMRRNGRSATAACADLVHRPAYSTSFGEDLTDERK